MNEMNWRREMRKAMKIRGIVLVAVLALSSCRTMEFYGQAVTGQVGMLAKRQSIDKVAAETEDEKLKARLALTRELLEFAKRELDMPSGGSYELPRMA